MFAFCYSLLLSWKRKQSSNRPNTATKTVFFSITLVTYRHNANIYLSSVKMRMDTYQYVSCALYCMHNKHSNAIRYRPSRSEPIVKMYTCCTTTSRLTMFMIVCHALDFSVLVAAVGFYLPTHLC